MTECVTEIAVAFGVQLITANDDPFSFGKYRLLKETPR